jgi:hypothetical protein
LICTSMMRYAWTTWLRGPDGKPGLKLQRAGTIHGYHDEDGEVRLKDQSISGGIYIRIVGTGSSNPSVAFGVEGLGSSVYRRYKSSDTCKIRGVSRNIIPSCTPHISGT